MHAENLKIFVGGFGPLIKEQDMRNHFGKFGPITSTNVVKNFKKGFNKGYGFVVCGDKDTVQRILKHDQVIGNQVSLTQIRYKWRIFSPQVCSEFKNNLGDRHVTCSLAHGGSNRQADMQQMINTRVHVTRLGPSVTNYHLELYFSKFGEVKKAFVIRHHKTKKSKYFGYVEFFADAGKDLVLAEKSHSINGAAITCGAYLPKSMMVGSKSSKNYKGGSDSTACDEKVSGTASSNVHSPTRHTKKPGFSPGGFGHFVEEAVGGKPGQATAGFKGYKPRVNSDKMIVKKKENATGSMPNSPNIYSQWNIEMQTTVRDDWCYPMNTYKNQGSLYPENSNIYGDVNQGCYTYDYAYLQYPEPHEVYRGYEIQYYRQSEVDGQPDQWLYDYGLAHEYEGPPNATGYCSEYFHF
jgi:hypothetical protein